VSEDDTDDPGTGEGDAGDDEYTPPTRDEWDRVKRAMKKAQEDTRRWRKKAQELEQGKEGASEEAGKQVADKYRPLLIQTKAQAALLEAGVETGKAARALKLLDLSDLDVDDDGEVDGLTDQVDDLKNEWPELFEAKQEKRQRAPRVNGAGRTPSAPQAKSSAARLSALFER
jgi:hypothetical protein